MSRRFGSSGQTSERPTLKNSTHARAVTWWTNVVQNGEGNASKNNTERLHFTKSVPLNAELHPFAPKPFDGAANVIEQAIDVDLPTAFDTFRNHGKRK
jgi:hypothetical protein